MRRRSSFCGRETVVLTLTGWYVPVSPPFRRPIAMVRIAVVSHYHHIHVMQCHVVPWVFQRHVPDEENLLTFPRYHFDVHYRFCRPIPAMFRCGINAPANHE